MIADSRVPKDPDMESSIDVFEANVDTIKKVPNEESFKKVSKAVAVEITSKDVDGSYEDIPSKVRDDFVADVKVEVVVKKCVSNLSTNAAEFHTMLGLLILLK